MTGAIDIIKSDSMVEDRLFDRHGNLKTEDLFIYIGEGATTAQMPGAEIVQLITGIRMPEARYAWHFQQGSLYASGNAFAAGVDISTGRLVYVVSITGNQIMGLFE